MNIWSHVVNSLASIAIGALVTHCTMGEAKAQSVPFNAYSVSTLGGNCTQQGSVLTQTSGGKSVCQGAGVSGQVMTSAGPGADTTWATPTSGLGNVTGPLTSTPGDIAVFSDATGRLLGDSGTPVPAGQIVGTTATQTLTNKSIGASQINSGTLSSSVIPAPTSSALGGVKSATAPTNEFQTGIDNSGNPLFAQPSFGNISGQSSLSQLPSIADGSVLANISGASAAPQSVSASSWFDKAYCNTVGYVIARTTGTWTCSNAIPINASWLGAVGDGITDNTTVFNNIIASAVASGSHEIFLPGGANTVYLTDEIQYGPTTGSFAPSFVCEDGTVIRKKTNDGNPLIQIGSPTQGGYNFPIKKPFNNCTLDGTVGTPADIRIYDLTRSNFVNLRTTGGTIGVDDYGSVGLIFTNPIIQNSQRGMKFQSFSPSYVGGTPNSITLNSPVVTENSSMGIDFEDGSDFFINSGDIESNGNGVEGAGGVYIQPNTAYPNGLGAVITNTWFEANNGGYHLFLNGGNNVVNSSKFVVGANVTYDINVYDGSAQLNSLDCENVKSPNVIFNTTANGNSVSDPGQCAVTYTSSNTRYFGSATASFPALIYSGAYNASTRALPTCSSTILGARAFITDASGSVTFHGTYSSGGSGVSPVYCTGTNWVYD